MCLHFLIAHLNVYIPRLLIRKNISNIYHCICQSAHVNKLCVTFSSVYLLSCMTNFHAYLKNFHFTTDLEIIHMFFCEYPKGRATLKNTCTKSLYFNTSGVGLCKKFPSLPTKNWLSIERFNNWLGTKETKSKFFSLIKKYGKCHELAPMILHFWDWHLKSWEALLNIINQT